MVPAAAAGNAGLSRLVVAHPVPGWPTEPAAAVNRFVTNVGGLEAATIVARGGDELTAADGWRNPARHADYLVVALVALSFGDRDTTDINSQTRAAAAAALASLCAGAPMSSVHSSSVAAVPGSHTVTCTPSRGPAPEAVGWARANVLALVISVSGAVPAPTLGRIAAVQYRAMPPGGYAVPGRASALGRVVEVLVLLLGLAAVWVLFRRARRELGPAAAGPGRLSPARRSAPRSRPRP